VSEEPENRMLFDLRGRRKRVIQVIYVMLAVVMAASLLVIGLPGGVNPFGGGGSVVSQDLADLSIERAEKLETRLEAAPNNAKAQEELIRARITAGNNLIEIDDEGRQQAVTAEANEQYDLAAQAWNKYLKTTSGQPDQGVAQLVANMLFSLAQGSSIAQFESNVQAAADAQEQVARAAERKYDDGRGDGPPPTAALVTLATYQYYAQDFAAANRSRSQALAGIESEGQKKQVTTQLDAVEKDAKRIGKVLERARKQARKDGGKSLENPFGGFGSAQPEAGQVPAGP
jgi:hypothetical protein